MIIYMHSSRPYPASLNLYDDFSQYDVPIDGVSIGENRKRNKKVQLITTWVYLHK